MNRLLKILFICLTVCLSACDSNRLVSDADIKGTILDNSNGEYETLNTESAPYFGEREKAIVDVETVLANLINQSSVELDSKVVLCYEKEDSNVKDDEIIVDFYDTYEVKYYYIEEYKEIGMKAMHTVKCPAENIVLDKEGKYYVSGANFANYDYNITLELGKHYVFQYGTVKNLIENYYSY